MNLNRLNGLRWHALDRLAPRWRSALVAFFLGCGLGALAQDAPAPPGPDTPTTNTTEEAMPPENGAPDGATNAAASTNASLAPTNAFSGGTNLANSPGGTNAGPNQTDRSRGPGRDRSSRRFGRSEATPAATNEPAPDPLEYAAYKVIYERNIFNPTRRPRRGPASSEERPAPRVDWFSLVGTMSYEKGYFAFFDGSNYQYRKVLQPEATIAGYKILEVTQNSVKLSAGTNQLEMRIGGQMRREDEGEWAISGRFGEVSLAASSSASSSGGAKPEGAGTSSSSSEPAAGATAGESDILKKLMQKREQEMNK
jgi:hypothetical protein